MTTMIGPLRRATQIAADRTAIACGDVELTYAQTWERCRRLLGALRALGMQPGDRIAHRGRELPSLRRAVPGGARRRDGPRAAQPAPHRCGAELRARRFADARAVHEPRDRRAAVVRRARRRSRGWLREAAGRGRARRLPRRPARHHDRGPLLHRRHDGSGEGRDAHPSQPDRRTRCTIRPSTRSVPRCAGSSPRRSSTPRGRSPCSRPCGRGDVRSCCPRSTRRTRSTSSSATA